MDNLEIKETLGIRQRTITKKKKHLKKYKQKKTKQKHNKSN